jgi:hypothetical protein
MKSNEYRGYIIEISLEYRGDEGNKLYYYCPSIAYLNGEDIEDLDGYATYEEARMEAEEYINRLESSYPNIFNYDEREDNDESPDGDWSDPIL